MGLLAGDEEVIEERVVTRVEKFLKPSFYEPIGVNNLTGTILDGATKQRWPVAPT